MEGTAVGAPVGSATHVQVSADGKWVIGLFGSGCKQPATAQIVKIDLKTRLATVVIHSRPGADNQWPAFSPDGERISYTPRTRTVMGVPDEALMVDHREVYSCHGLINFQWVDARGIAAACLDEVVVLDTAIGQPLSRYGLWLASTGSPLTQHGLLREAVHFNLPSSVQGGLCHVSWSGQRMSMP